MKTYVVSQTFETIGDHRRLVFTRKRDAERAANLLRRIIASMVAEFETPAERVINETGRISEIQAWRSARETAGVDYDEDGNRTPNSPTTYGREAGMLIATASVEIEVIND